MPNERPLTDGPGGRILTNTGVWSPCGDWIVFDARSDAAGERFDGTRIQAVNVRTKELGRQVVVVRGGAGAVERAQRDAAQRSEQRPVRADQHQARPAGLEAEIAPHHAIVDRDARRARREQWVFVAGYHRPSSSSNEAASPSSLGPCIILAG